MISNSLQEYYCGEVSQSTSVLISALETKRTREKENKCQFTMVQKIIITLLYPLLLELSYLKVNFNNIFRLAKSNSYFGSFSTFSVAIYVYDTAEFRNWSKQALNYFTRVSLHTLLTADSDTTSIYSECMRFSSSYLSLGALGTNDNAGLEIMTFIRPRK